VSTKLTGARNLTTGPSIDGAATRFKARPIIHPYSDGRDRAELTSGEDRTPEQLRQAVEKLMLAAGDNRPDVRTAVHAGHQNHTSVHITADIDQTDEILDRIRHDPDQFQDN
jgi:hypothetical protein